MIETSKYAKEFVSNMMSEKKYQALYSFAAHLLEIRNEVSKIFTENLDSFLNMSQKNFVTYMRHNFIRQNEIPSSFDCQLYTDVYTAYSNRMDNICHKLTFQKQTLKAIELYKKNCPKKNKKKSDFKSISYSFETTELSAALTYLARYGSENSIEQINNSIKKESEKENPNDSRIKYLKNVLNKCEKFGFERLYKLASSRRERTLSKYNNRVIEFKSLTFRGKSRKKEIIEYNSNYNSVINAFINLSSIPGYDSLYIPVKFCKDYHGGMKEYSKSVNEYEYCLTFKKDRVKVVLTINKDRYYPDLVDVTEENTVGADVNIKNNAVYCSDESEYDYDRKLIDAFAKLCSDIDRCKALDENYVPSKKKQELLQRYQQLIKQHNQELVARICKDFQKKGYKYVAMENLDNSFGKCYVDSKEFSDINYNRIRNFLNLCSLKDEFEHIGRKYDIRVILVNPAYTSQRCPVCGCIHEENRMTQENFECIECSHKDNADHNASINIKEIGVSTVLRHKFLKLNKIGNSYIPKKIKRDKIKDMLLSCRETPKRSRDL